MTARTKKVIIERERTGRQGPERTVTLRFVVEVPDRPDRAGRWVAQGSHTAINPDTGLDAVWLDGEPVPDWAIDPEILATRAEPPAE